MTDWQEDCLRYQGRILDGFWRHWCSDWDDLPIDETCPEFSVCTCRFDWGTPDELAAARAASRRLNRD